MLLLYIRILIIVNLYGGIHIFICKILSTMLVVFHKLYCDNKYFTIHIDYCSFISGLHEYQTQFHTSKLQVYIHGT